MGIKQKIKNNFWGEYAVSQYHVFMSWFMPKILSDEKAVRKYYKSWTGQELDLSNPQTFSQKQQWYKLNARLPLMQKCADKYAVREYINDCGYQYLLNTMLGCYDDPDDIDLASLPNQFVIKASHGSGFNVIVKDKSKLNWNRTRIMLKSWLRQNIAWGGREWVYKDMPRHIIIEKYLEDETGELRDYKFFCFNGEPQFMQLEVGRYTNHNARNFYDMDWNLMPFGKSIPHDPTLDIPKPKMFDKMKEIAKDLCKPFQFVRVDLYQVDGKVYFGELTFFPAGGAPDFIPSNYDSIVGEMWKLENVQ